MNHGGIVRDRFDVRDPSTEDRRPDVPPLHVLEVVLRSILLGMGSRGRRQEEGHHQL